ncbi:MAG: Leucyl-tRNA synthetase [Candidatus Nomurabacteria bacterium GW2011_GWA2_43_15]|uniref:Leucine--tRNA ligase n=2 Tax=Candidatus Nomuraibacteriota TaxID=1752729 RepID=A0A0G1GK41_9BACT|nr:MAG: Leucyl-tRNA synthetase [Candidatus Nomurabacteria bacterium GW2011_GWA2_43_15]KKT19472.1 MAG: Leucyl-tRNA synthetase [Candidatus Nomurabacteria bacterium GW2011_GWB1_43_7]
MREYDHKKIEKKWQTDWEKKRIYQAKDFSKKPKYYSLIEFPYPSGDGLHVGHPRPYIGMDVISRKRRLEGYNVLYPIGWDAFGLPTENYAIKTGKDPRIVTKKNSDTFRRQIKSLGISFDWSREVYTTDPKYYKWTQWIFLQFLKKGLAYKAKIAINWCPKDKIGLANEEVVGGNCERCGTSVEKREKEQWMLGITKYADRLDKDLDTVDYLPQIKLSQRNWIGRSEGAEIDFEIKGSDKKIKVFTTRPDTIFGATYLVLSPEHAFMSFLDDRSLNSKEIKEYVASARKKTEIERTNDEKVKTGVELKGIKAINPANKEKIPIWIADYVLPHYGTGAIMAVPAHDERDFAFAKKYGLEIKNVIEPIFIAKFEEGLPFVERNAISAIIKHWSEDKYLALKWKTVPWVTFVTGGIEKGQTPEAAARHEIREETGFLNLKLTKTLPNTHSKFYHGQKKENRFAHFTNFYFELENGEQVEIDELEGKAKHDVIWLKPDEIEKLLTPEGQIRDWKLLQKDIVYMSDGILANSGKFSGQDSQKAKKEIIKFVGGKEKITFKLRDWVFSRQRYWGEPIPVIFCNKCGIVPVPEKDLPVELPKVKNYQPTDSGESPLANIAKWVNTKCPKCKGPAKRETDTMPNWAGSSWYYLRYTDPKNSKAFADKKNLKYWTPVDWYNGGHEHTTLHLLYSRFWHKFLFDLGLVSTSEPYKKRTSHGLILAEGGEKMSKSRGNVINPDDIVKRYGADTLRLYEMFMGPFDQAIAWSEEAIIGPRRFLERVWSMQYKVQKNKKYTEFEIEKTVKKTTEDIEEMKFNTAISALMIFVNEAGKSEFISQEVYEKFLLILSPFAPHIAEEIWRNLGHKKSIHLSDWPKWDENLIRDEEVTIALQINGKVRAEIMIKADSDEEEIKKRALANEAVLRYLAGESAKKVIYVKNRLINIVV